MFCSYRRLFHLYTYFFLFYASVSSVLTILRRILTSLVVALFLLPRLDHPLVIGGLEFLDKGNQHVVLITKLHALVTTFLKRGLVHTSNFDES